MTPETLETQQHPETPTNSGNPPVLGAVGDVLTQITDLLDPETQAELQAENLETQRLISILKSEIEKVRKSLDYDYEIYDYEKRLSISDEKFEEILGRVFSENNLLEETFENLLSRYSGDKEVYKKLLIKEFLEDLVYESLNNKDLIKYKIEKLDLGMFKLKERFKNDKEQLLEDLKNAENIYLWTSALSKFKEVELKVIFSNLKSVKVINLEFNNLGDLRDLGVEELQAIFSNLNNVKVVNLSCNDIGELSVEELRVIFSNLKNAKSVNLQSNNLGSLGEEELQSIFSNLKNTKSVNLKGNNLNEDQEIYIKSILPNTKIIF